MSISINGSTGISGVVGTASTPALIGTDADTGLYFPTANEVALATAGSQRLLIDSSGNIVIGGTLTSGSFIPTSSTVPTNGIYLSAANTVAVATNGAGRFFVDASGRVSIGSSASGSPLNVSEQGVSGAPVFRFIGNAGNGNYMRGGWFASDNTTELAQLSVDGTVAMYIGTVLSTPVILTTNNIERLRITSAGLMGLGTNPNSDSRLHVKSGANDSNPVLRLEAATNNFLNFRQTGSVYDIHVTAGDPLSFTIGASERARIDSSGRLLIGTSTASGYSSSRVIITGAGTDPTGASNLVLQIGQANGSVTVDEQIGVIAFGDTSGYSYANIVAAADLAAGSDSPGRLSFSTTYDGASSPTERMRILANGFVKAKNNGGTFPTGATHEFSSDENIYVAFRVENQNNLSGSGTYNSLLGTNCNNTSSYHFVGNTGASDKIYIYGNGNIVNSNNSYGLMSDVKLKENIVDANSQWDDLKTLRVVNFNFKEETGYQTHTQIGFIAQEVEQVSPGLVYETPDLDIEGNNLGTVTKVLQSSVLYTKAVKALQEAMERIETLEAQNSDFATRLTALESA
jgi:hypothetical protein